MFRRALEELAAKAAAEEAAEAEVLAARKAAEEAHRLQAEAEALRATKEALVTVRDSRDVSDTAAPQAAPAAKTKSHAHAQPHQRPSGLEPEVEDSLHGSSVDVQVRANVISECALKHR